MEEIDEERFNNAAELLSKLDNEDSQEIDEKEFNNLLDEMQDPTQAQRHLAVQIKRFLDKRIKNEMDVKGVLSDHTRRWVLAYNLILEKIQKALYGDRSVNLHVHKVTHSQIAAKIREEI